MPYLLSVDRWGTLHDVRDLVRSLSLTIWSKPVESQPKQALIGELYPLSKLKHPVHIAICVRLTNVNCLRRLTFEEVRKAVEDLSYELSSIQLVVKAGNKVNIDIIEIANLDIEVEEQLTPDYWDNKAQLVYGAYQSR